jgi:hypothetical protein
VSETFTLSSGNFVHTRTGQLSQGEDGINTISLDGTIRGLGRGDNAISRATTAYNGNIKPNFAADASGVYSELGGLATLFTNNFNTLSVTRNEFAGTVDYSVSFTDSPSDNLPSGILDLTFTVQDNEPTRLFASFVIPERTIGNVIQDIGTSTEGTFTIQGSVQGKSDFPFVSLLSFVEDRVNNNRPQPIDYQTLRLTDKSINKDELNNTVNFNFTWTYTLELSQVDSQNGPITVD